MGLLSLLLRMGYDDSEVRSGIKQTESVVTGFGNRISNELKSKLAGAFTVAAIASFGKAILDNAGKIIDLADAYKLTTDQVQIMTGSAIANGVEIEALIQTTAKLTEARQKALEGDKKTISAFERMGISMATLENGSTGLYDMLVKIGSASSSRADGSQAGMDFADILGAKSSKLRKAIEDLQNAPAIDIVPEETLRSIDEAGDMLSIAWKNALGLASVNFVNFINGIKDVRETLGDIFAGAKSDISSGSIGSDEDSFTRLGKIWRNRRALNKAARESANVTPGGGGLLAEQDAASKAKELESINGKLLDMQVKAMTVEEKRAFYWNELAKAQALYNRGLKEGDDLLRAKGELAFANAAAGLIANKPKDGTEKDAAQSRFARPSTGNLASIGGLYFGADYNTRLMTLQQKQVTVMQSVADNTRKTAETLSGDSNQ
jgi:hypothetical protein